MKNNIDNVVVCGLGAAGSNVLQHLLYAYPALNYTVVDFDIVEARNVDPGTQPYSKVDINRPKTQAFQRIAIALKNKKINAINKKIMNASCLIGIAPDSPKTLFIDAFDNADSRNIFIHLAKANVIHIGFSASLSGEAVWDGVYTRMQTSKGDAEIDVCEMSIARPFIFALTSLAAITIVNFLDTGKKENIYFDKHFIMRKF
jgi:hypothetical protein